MVEKTISLKKYCKARGQDYKELKKSCKILGLDEFELVQSMLEIERGVKSREEWETGFVIELKKKMKNCEPDENK